MWLVPLLVTPSRRAASGNNNRLSTPWREVISLAGVARSLSKAASSYRNVLVPKPIRGTRCEIEEARRLDMQSNDVIEVVEPFGGGISEVTLLPERLPFLRAKCFGGTGSEFSRRRTASIFA
jgi:hypothetical protein